MEGHIAAQGGGVKPAFVNVRLLACSVTSRLGNVGKPGKFGAVEGKSTKDREFSGKFPEIKSSHVDDKWNCLKQ